MPIPRTSLFLSPFHPPSLSFTNSPSPSPICEITSCTVYTSLTYGILFLVDFLTSKLWHLGSTKALFTAATNEFGLIAVLFLAGRVIVFVGRAGQGWVREKKIRVLVSKRADNVSAVYKQMAYVPSDLEFAVMNHLLYMSSFRQARTTDMCISPSIQAKPASEIRLS